MAQFVANGYLRFDAVVPEAINRAMLEDIAGGRVRAEPAGTRLSRCYRGSTVRSLLELPPIAGAIESLVGEDPLFDHQAVHTRPPREPFGQRLHADAVIDTRTAFDIQLMYYPHEVTLEMGGTLLVPGSHFRRINEMDVARYQNLLGQVRLTCPAGTMLILHHGLWHCARRNGSDRERMMLKIRLNPRVPQIRLWNTDDLDGREELNKALYTGEPQGEDDIQSILSHPEPWFDDGAARLEVINRVKLWRSLSGRPGFDADYWLSRLENVPQ